MSYVNFENYVIRSVVLLLLSPTRTLITIFEPALQLFRDFFIWVC